MSTTAIFSGNSRFANDFQQIIDRTVSIASLPLTQLQNQETTLNNQSSALTSLDTKFTALQSALKTLSSKIGTSALSATLDDPTVARATASAGATPGDYSLEVVNLGSRTVTLSTDSLPKVNDPSSQNITNASSLTLTVAGTNYHLAGGVSNLSALAAQINASQAGVQATVLNIGSSTNPDYRLSVVASKLGNISVQLSDGSQLLVNTIASGALASYRVNGVPSDPIQTDTRDVTLSPGIQASLLKSGTTNIHIDQVGAGIEDALSAFVTAFNGAVDETDKHRGGAKGALQGLSLVSTLSGSLRQLANYHSSDGSLNTIEDLGITFDKTGHLVFSQADFEAGAAKDPAALTKFLGSTSTDGFFKFASDTLDQLENPTTGDLQNAISQIKKQITAQDTMINSEQDRVNLARDTVTTQMAQADAMIASLEQQVTFMTGLIAATKAAGG